MDIRTYKNLSKERINSGKMSDEEWEEILTAILNASENDGLPNFDSHVDPERNNDGDFDI